MADSNKYSILLIALEASPSEAEYLTNAGYSVLYGGNNYRAVEAVQMTPAEITGTILQPQDFQIKNVEIVGTFLARLSNNYPYSTVYVTVREIDIDIDTDAVLDSRVLFTGMVYGVSTKPLTGFMDISCRGWKYYTEITAGVPCTEQCAWQYLGDVGCGASIVVENHVVASISGVLLTLVDDFADTRTGLFNKGYVEFGAARIKIKYYNTGKVLQLGDSPPSDWEDETVTVYSGCDRFLNTCRQIYSNEDRFLGLGIAMIDYNPMYEQP